MYNENTKDFRKIILRPIYFNLLSTKKIYFKKTLSMVKNIFDLVVPVRENFPRPLSLRMHLRGLLKDFPNVKKEDMSEMRF